jgi:tRNA dimethylallyltransferase
MLGAGAIEEVEALAARGLDPELPVMKALGVPPLLRRLRGETTVDQATAEAKQDTRRYAKRQLTWFRNQTPNWTRIAPCGARHQAILLPSKG